MTHLPDEIEAKFYPINVPKLRKKLIKIGAKCISPMRLMRRIVFDDIDNPQLPVAYIRVRDEGDKITFSAKDYPSQEKGHKHQRELVVNVSDFEATVNILKVIGLKQTHYQENKRETWKIEDTEICIDIWPGLEPYIEVESSSVEGLDKISAMLPIQKSRRYDAGLLDVYIDVYGWSKQEALKNVTYMTFEKLDFLPIHT